MSDATIQNPKSKIQNLQWDKMSGLIPAIIQQADSGTVLMLGYMNAQALALTQQTGRVHFWSRSRRELWLKGEKSGNYLLVDSLQADCDGDALLVLVHEATGSTPVCHTGAATCFDADAAPHPNPPPIWGREQDTPHPNPPPIWGREQDTPTDLARQQGGPPPAPTEIGPQGESHIAATEEGQGEQRFAPTNNPVPQSSVLSPQSSVLTLIEVVARLMGPDGCPWDMAQTHTSLKPNLLEETYEILDALDALDVGDDIPRERKLAKLADELGDVLGQVIYQAQIGTTNGEFTLDDVAAAFSAKLVRRHPHVFATTQISGLDEALKNWEEIKKTERTAEGGDGTVGTGLRGIPPAMPALHYAQQVQGRVKRNGYVWPEREALLVHLGESLAIVAQSGDEADVLTQVGELLWHVVLLARSLNVNAEQALRVTARRFVTDYRDLCK
jgi:MazG family protein